MASRFITEKKPSYTKSYFDKKPNVKRPDPLIEQLEIQKRMASQTSVSDYQKQVPTQSSVVDTQKRGEVINHNIQEIVPVMEKVKVRWWESLFKKL